MGTVSNDQLSQVTKQISDTLDKLEGSNCFELPRSLSMDSLSLKKSDVSESVAAVMNCSNSIDGKSKHIRHVSNPTSIFTPDPFSKITDSSHTHEVARDKNVEVDTLKNECIQVDSRSECIQVDLKTRNDETQTMDSRYPDIIAEMQEKIDNLQKEIMNISKQKTISTIVSKEFVDHETVEILKSKLSKAELEIKSLNEQKSIISAENQKLVMNVSNKTENVTRERENLYSMIHDLIIDNSFDFHGKSLLDQISKNLYSLVEHSNDALQLDRIRVLFASFREAIIQIVKESKQLDQKISSLAESSNKIRLESSAIISQLEEKTRVLIEENRDLLKKINDLQYPGAKNNQTVSFQTLEQESNQSDALAEHQEQQIHDQEKKKDTERQLKEKIIDENQHLKDQEKIKNLKLEIERLKGQLSILKEKTPEYPLSDLYEKILALINRDSSSGINIKEILEWVEEKRIVMEELEKQRSSYSNLSYKHKHLLKEYSDQKSTMDEIKKKIASKESEWQTKFQEFTTNAHKLETRHKTLESIIRDYDVQFQGILSLSSDPSSNFDHPLPFLKYFGNLQKINSSLDHSLQHATSALSESQRVTSHALKNLDAKSSQIATVEKEKQEIQSLITKLKSEISFKDKEISAVKTQNVKLQDQNLKLTERLGRIADGVKLYIHL